MFESSLARVSTTGTRHWRARPLVAACTLVGLAALLSGCFDAPKLEDRWTRIDLDSSNPVPNQALVPGTVQPMSLSATITYRSIITGFAVAELRASDSVGGASIAVDPNAPRQQMATDIDAILQSSVPLGRSARAITGWDHLMQRIDFTFTGAVPATPPAGLFLLCYLGSGVKIELPRGGDTIVVTPFKSGQYQILPVGMKLALAGPGSH